MRGTKALAILVLGLITFAAGQDSSPLKKVQPNPQWEKMKMLVGHWEGMADDSGQKYKATASFRMTGDGSALMSVLGEGSPYEMVSMIHLDGPKLMMTHYCAAHNQPRFRAVESGDPNKVVFEFLDVTNAAPGAGYMYRVAFKFDGPDHHIEEWTFRQGDKEQTGFFDLKRVK